MIQRTEAPRSAPDRSATRNGVFLGIATKEDIIQHAQQGPMEGEQKKESKCGPCQVKANSKGHDFLM